MRIRLLASTLLALACAQCQVDLGRPPDAACTPDRDLFVSQVFPLYLIPNQCGNGGCHDFTDGHGTLRLRPVDAPPPPGTPLSDWPPAWRENYFSAAQLVRCDQPLRSRLLTVPEGEGNLHPPGPVVLDRGVAAQLIQAWVHGP